MSPSDAEVRELVRSILGRMLASPGLSPAETAPGTKPAVETSTAATAKRSKLIDEVAVRAMSAGSTATLPAGALVTPLAREAAQARGITLQEAGATPGPAAPMRAAEPASQTPPQRRVAIGADHGGYALKEALKSHLTSLGYEAVDCGTHNTAPVDYPDIAYAVARLVADGACANGIIVDGAGIGSCMAANKVPGVRAALCYDHATAVNSREHNFANVLTLGAGLIGVNLAKQIVADWLATPYGAERHAKRVEKIMAIEKRYGRAQR